MFTQDDLIYAYTRRDAIRDGEQAELYPNLRAEAGIKIPVYFTRSVIQTVEIAVANKNWCNDWHGVMWDIFTMFKRAALQNKYSNSFTFQVIITGVGRGKYHTFLAAIGPTDIDDPSPAITIMYPDED